MPINDIVFRPAWFISSELVFQIISMLITCGISFYSYKVYKISGNKSYKYLGVSFFAITFGLLFRAISDLIVLYSDSSNWIYNLPLRSSYIYTGSLILYAFLILSGYVILTCLASNVKNKRTISLLLLIALLCALLVRQARSFTFFYFFEFVLLVVYIVPYMYDNYNEKKNKNSYLVFLAFLLLSISSLLFIGLSSYDLVQFYVGGHFISLLAYIMLLVNMILVLRK